MSLSFVHQSLVYCSGVFKVERHLRVALHLMTCVERGFFFIFLCHLNLMISFVWIEEEFEGVREIYAQSPAALMFFHHDWIGEPTVVPGLIFLPYEGTTVANVQTVSQSFILLFSNKLPPIVTICLGYSGWMAIFIHSYEVSGEDPVRAPATILHSVGIIVLLCSITTPSGTGNLSIQCAVDGTACIFLRPGRLMIPLYREGDRTTMKFIMALVECSSSLSDTISEIFPSGQDISPLNPKSGVVVGIICLLISGWSLLKQCFYRTSKVKPLTTYIR
uniref:Uncharacterized protein n=1 Tax=Tanacetum cinerariifolium TaxID=118510 RepID=A0A699JUP8_TANCI|nr:hypothetical protein [Tanacetum cinerariifolium]